MGNFQKGMLSVRYKELLTIVIIVSLSNYEKEYRASASKEECDEDKDQSRLVTQQGLSLPTREKQNLFLIQRVEWSKGWRKGGERWRSAVYAHFCLCVYAVCLRSGSLEVGGKMVISDLYM